MRKNATRKLAMELSRLSQAFRQRQKDYLNELKYRQDRGRRGRRGRVGGRVSEQSDEE